MTDQSSNHDRTRRSGSRAQPQRFGNRGGPRGQKPGRKGGTQHRRDRWDEAPVLFGHHAVAFAIQNPKRTIKRILATENAARKLEDVITASNRDVQCDPALPRDLDRLLGPDTVHQGVMAEVEALDKPELDDLIATCADRGPIVMLDQVTDPHNVGAVLRSAAVFGAAGVVMTRRHSPPLHGVLAKSASGALELVPVCLVQNLGAAINIVKAAGMRCIGLDGEAETSLHTAPLDGPTALVLGAEGKGLRESTAAACETLVRIAADGPIASLNVSNAAAVTLHFAMLARAKT